VRDLVLDGARTAEAFAAYGAERMARMARLRLAADVMAAAHAEDSANRGARRRYVDDRMGAMETPIFPLLLALFAGPETVGEELLDPAVLDDIRAA
jgi:hypothetical protein